MIIKDEPQEKFDKLRWAELKHGRVAMLAVVGYLVTAAGIRFPGAEDIPSGFAAFSTLWSTHDGLNVCFQFLATVGFAEMLHRDVTGKGEFPGDFRNGALDFGWDKQSAEWKKNKRTVELNQGRAAQMGIFGLMVHDMMGNVDGLLPPTGMSGISISMPDLPF